MTGGKRVVTSWPNSCNRQIVEEKVTRGAASGQRVKLQGANEGSSDAGQEGSVAECKVQSAK